MNETKRTIPHPVERRSFLKVSGAAASAAVVAGLDVTRGAHAAGSDVIRIGMIGSGGRCTGAAGNVMTVDKGARLVAMCDLFADRIELAHQTLQATFPGQIAVDSDHRFVGFDGYRKVIDSVDVVLIACAAKFHPTYLKAAVEAGKHVFVEKPHGIDPPGVREVIKACELAKQKGLSVLSGLQSRFHPGFREAMQRVHDGAIGDIVAIEENYLRGPYRLVKREPGYNEVQYQFRNQYHFTWLAGDDVPQSLAHNLDRSAWAMHEQMPVKCHGMGGRSSSFDEVYGDAFDHHAITYEYASGVRLYAFCRTQMRCYNEDSSILLGTKGRCFLSALSCRIEGQNEWRYNSRARREGELERDAAYVDINPYCLEQKALFDAIRSGKPINSGYHMAHSTLCAIMGQLSCYTGKEITWDEVMKSDFCYDPKPERCHFDMEPPLKPGPNGQYPLRVPGVTKLL